MSFIEKGGSRYDMIYDTCSWEVDMIYDTCSWRPLYVEAQHGIRTLYGGVTRFGCLTLLLWKLRLIPLKNKRHNLGYCHRRGEHTCGEASSGSVAVSAKAAIAKGTTLVLTGWR